MALAPSPALFDWSRPPLAALAGPRPRGVGLGPARRPRRPRPPLGARPTAPRAPVTLAAGLAAPTAEPAHPPLAVAPGGGRGCRNPEAIAAWQRA